MQQPQKKKMSQEGIKAFGEFADSTFFKIPAMPHQIEFLDVMKKALNCFSPRALNVPAKWYAEMLTYKKDEFRYTDVNILKQILVQATGRAMNLQPRQYAAYLEAMDVFMYEFGEVWNAAIAKFEEEYPEPEAEPKKETTVVELPTTIGQA